MLGEQRWHTARPDEALDRGAQRSGALSFPPAREDDALAAAERSELKSEQANPLD